MKKESEDEEFWIEPEEQHEECQNLDIICEWNEDECYEFGGTEEDRKNHPNKSLWREFCEAFPFLVIIILFCVGVFWLCFKYVH